MATKKKPKQEKITTERFFTEQAEHLKLKLIAGESGLGRTIIETALGGGSGAAFESLTAGATQQAVA